MSADLVTGLGVLLALAAAVAVARGEMLAGLLLLIVSSLADLLDGPLAKASGTASPRGAFLDSVADRVSDALLLAGMAWYLAATRRGEDAVLPFVLYAVTSLVSYERAKGELLGLEAKGGLMERAERVVALAATLLAAYLYAPALVIGLEITTVAVAATALGRFVRIFRAAGRVGMDQSADRVDVSGPAVLRAGASLHGRSDFRSDSRRVHSRWLAWREARLEGRSTLLGGVGQRLSPGAFASGERGPKQHRRARSLDRWRARRAAAARSSSSPHAWWVRTGEQANLRERASLRNRRPES